MELGPYATSPHPTSSKLSEKYSEVSTGKVKFLTKAFHHENTHAPGKQMPHISCPEPIYRHGAVDIKAACSLWGIPPFSSFKREWKFIFILYTPSLIECVHTCTWVRVCVCVFCFDNVRKLKLAVLNSVCKAEWKQQLCLLWMCLYYTSKKEFLEVNMSRKTFICNLSLYSYMRCFAINNAKVGKQINASYHTFVVVKSPSLPTTNSIFFICQGAIN